jgi:hypothetical protein
VDTLEADAGHLGDLAEAVAGGDGVANRLLEREPDPICPLVLTGDPLGGPADTSEWVGCHHPILPTTPPSRQAY